MILDASANSGLMGRHSFDSLQDVVMVTLILHINTIIFTNHLLLLSACPVLTSSFELWTLQNKYVGKLIGPSVKE